ncbi:Lipase member K [Halotydeus destructor]|nr:Lipase member K [Halotydeus destructor]
MNCEYYSAESKDADIGRTTAEFIESRNFKCERHYITTSDGYILNAYRIKNPFNEKNNSYPILLTSSTMLDVNQWLWHHGGDAEAPKDPSAVNGSSVLNANLGYALANHGYDVWLFNLRGVGDDLNHTHLSPSDDKFWEFSLDQSAQIDIPSVIDYVRSCTKQKTVGMVGFSQSALLVLSTMSSVPKYNDIIKPAILFGHGAVGSKPKNNLLTDTVAKVLAAKAGPLMLKSHKTSAFVTTLCSPPLTAICSLMLNVDGKDPDNIDKTRIPVYTSQFPAGTSTWSVAQALQTLKYTEFAMFDYGMTGNLMKYGEQSPPFYNFKKVTNPFISVYLGLNDKITNWDDSMHVLDLLGVNPVFEKYIIEYDKWNHLDFVLAENSGKYLVPRVIMTINRALSTE